ncbi:hypothetical protein YYC_03810 [Plasmodium yoelii 17X]|uniref:3'-5' exonuclease n=4 Tax=Plasmodium yoelii TaxID=5861 RepID=A0AAE9WTN5_PLAYO|nr:exonuclease, putative [Plasmodium yoelii]ETB58657.1 hypothetical protein YYC_03810 [Plasmodium yoelii 17X]WBY56288.1 3'-5' exonuclease [Plasmodium yoelii yoelii]CDU17188.1 exonuclease, putative [Plasmodium yoelii]VTZ76315.1 exonuclease, putative [Plasmodium yoelii]|eukprot:XP_729939.2 exonuclease, putative [Plasmodium yoelii]
MKIIKYTYNNVYTISKYNFVLNNTIQSIFLKNIKNANTVRKGKQFYGTGISQKKDDEISCKYNKDNIKTKLANKDSPNKYKDIKVIENENEGEEAADEINSNDIIAVDFEGTNLGRYGKICLMQIYTEIEKKDKVFEKYYIFDLLNKSVINSVKKIIENKKTLKVIHDCREDSSALYNQLDIKFENVYDTLRAHMLLLEKKKENDIYQISFLNLLHDYLGVKDDCLNNIKKEMYKNEKIWEIRPLSKISIIYALKNVKYLLPIYKIFDKLVSKKEVLEKSKDFVNYCFLNSRYKLPVDLAKRGNIIEAMLVSKSILNCVFKLNSTRKGIACTPSSVAQFNNVKVGDVVMCVVSNKSIDQKILYLCKHDDVYDYWNLKERPRGKFKPSIHENIVDPMIEFCDNEDSP